MSPTRRVLARAGGSTRWIAALVAIGLVTTGAGISLTAFASWLLAHTALVLTTSTASLVILAVRTSAVVRVVGRWCERWFGHVAAFSVLTRLRVRVFRDLVPVSPIALSKSRSGDLVTGIVDDVESMQDHLLRVAVPLLVGAFTIVLASAVLALTVSPVCGTVVFIGLALVSVLVPALSHRATARAAGMLIELRAEREALLVETLSASEELLVWGALDERLRSISRLDSDDADARRRIALIDSCASSVASTMAFATAFIAFLIARSPALDGKIDRPFLVVAPLVVLAAAEVAGPMAAAVANRARARAAAERLLSIAALPPRAVGTRAAVADPEVDGVVLEHVTFAHPDGPMVLVDQDLHVPAHETIVLTGPSGAGKSTIAALMLRALAPQHGRVAIAGQPVDGLSDESSARIIAALLQPDHLFDTTVRDNLRVAAPDATDGQMRSLLDALDLDLSGDGVDALDRAVGIDGASISGGERQRLLVARSLLADTPVLVLDEPTEHLDRERTQRLLDAIVGHRARRCTVILSHDESTHAIADRVLQVADGRISTVV